MLSVSGDGVRPAIELAKVIAKLRKELNWVPRRTIIFCFFHEFEDTCRTSIPKYLRSKIMAYLAVHGSALQGNGCLAVSGSDVIKSVVLQAVAIVRDSISKENFDKLSLFESCKNGESLVLLPRLLTDIPHTSFAFLTVRNSTSLELNSDQQMQARNRIIAQIIGLSIWRLADSVVLHWDPKDLEQELKTALKNFTPLELNDIKERIFSAIDKLIASMHNLTETTNKGAELSTLSGRMKNDQIMDLDRTLLCQNNDLRSKTDLALIPTILNEPLNKIAIFLGEMFQCYDNAAKVLQQG
ncbi:uncharacterized protein LOC105685543 [Athalia rosae]|uniref:uncharacterized protein LOC105685543 n=1 Tax=Athalia rosae TaxID=37344 RepID=UPI002033B3AF|nr:uncharacterized protein LOC105685543 [Athalia rosae]